ncbi:unnamed protein product [Cuscuta epithymum]|uniref:SWIM-type domain-containing protein n=1 Tax=Cuscuta epithymum TaxID=186058 RepID=A0AAV0D9C5_9ASTE|nr:unnamed protein product [Cuscuta epithymum]
MTSNCAESLNKVNVCAREYSVCKLVDFLRERMQQWFTERSEEDLKTSTFLSPKCENHLVDVQAESTRMQVKSTLYFEFEVVDRYCRSFVVNLNHKTCTCGIFQLEQFVCAHAVVAIRVRPRLSCYDFISPFYSRDSWLSTWSVVVHPIVDPQSWLVPQHVVIRFASHQVVSKDLLDVLRRPEFLLLGSFVDLDLNDKSALAAIFLGIIKNHVAILSLFLCSDYMCFCFLLPVFA